MKIILLGGPKNGEIVEHNGDINRPYYFRIQEEIENVKYYIYIFSHRMSNGTIYFKCENP